MFHVKMTPYVALHAVTAHLPARVFKMNRRLLPLFLSLTLTGASVTYAAEDEVDAAPSREIKEGIPAQELTPQILYQYLLAEVAAQRRQYALSASAFADLARSTRDARIARRATEIGMHTRQYDSALEAARLWTELQPAEPAARQALASLLVASQRGEELAELLQRDLAGAGVARAENLLRLNRVLARQTDKVAVQKLVERLTLPYLDVPEARFARAQAAVNAKDNMRGMAEIDQALALRSDWEMAAVFKVQQMSAEAALEFSAGFVKANPAAKEMRLAYARALVGAQRFDEARKEFRELLASFPDHLDIVYAVGVLSLQLNDEPDAELRLKQVAESAHAKADAARFYLAQIAESAKRWDDALAWYATVTPGEHYMPARVRGAQMLSKQNRILEARLWLFKARELEPGESTRLIIAESQLLRERGDLAEAFDFLERTLEATPDTPEIIYEAGMLAEMLKKFDRTEKHFRRLIELQPKSPQGYNALGYSLAERGERLAEAEQLIDTALSFSPDDYYILDSKGWVLFRRGKLEPALEYLYRAYKIKPEPEVAAHIGEVLWAQGKRAEALNIWQEADKANPGNAELAATIKRFVP